MSTEVPQESVLGPVLSYWPINDLELGFSSEVAAFVDDTTLFRMAKIQADCEELQRVFEGVYPCWVNAMGHKMANELQCKQMLR